MLVVLFYDHDVNTDNGVLEFGKATGPFMEREQAFTFLREQGYRPCVPGSERLAKDLVWHPMADQSRFPFKRVVILEMIPPS